MSLEFGVYNNGCIILMLSTKRQLHFYDIFMQSKIPPRNLVQLGLKALLKDQTITTETELAPFWLQG